MLLEESERFALATALAVIEAFTAAKAASTLDEELEIEFELTLMAARAASTLDDDREKELLEV